jgi:hypothetical protein
MKDKEGKDINKKVLINWKINVGMLDLSRNDPDLHTINYGELPCVQLFLDEDKNHPIRFEGELTDENLVKFMENYFIDKEKEKKYEKEEYLYTRGFGDFKYKNNNLIDIEAQEISCKPDILEISNNDLKFLIICNSGFFESANIFSQNNNNENIEKNIANYFINNLKNDKKLISDVIGEYFDYYITNEINKNQNDNENNLSCIIIDFVNN